MSANTTENSAAENFESLLQRLRQRDLQAWSDVVGRLRRVTLPWLRKRVGKLPAHALLSADEFVLEIFADSLAKFYDLFEKGRFDKEADLQSLLFKVAELKMKEAFARLQKETRIYRPATEDAFDAVLPTAGGWDTGDEQARERAARLQRHFATLEPEDQNLLQRFYAGEKLNRMALELGLTEDSLRKRKQRALDRLKQLMKLTINLLCLLWIL